MAWLVPTYGTYFFTLPKDLLTLLEEYTSADIHVKISTQRLHFPDGRPMTEFIAHISVPLATSRKLSFDVCGYQFEWLVFLKELRNIIEGKVTMERLVTKELEFSVKKTPVHFILSPWDSLRLECKLRRGIYALP